MSNIFLSVIIPCYNEEENLKNNCLQEVFDYLSKQSFSWEVIISDDESTDSSWELVESFTKGKKNFVHLKNEHGGKPFAVRAGLEIAKGDWVLFTDMDQATPISEFDKFLPEINSYDIVIGSRGMARKNFPIYRKLASIIFLSIRRALLLHNIVDSQCGFKAFKKEAALRIFPKLQVFKVKNKVYGWRVSAYDVELLFIAEKSGYKIKEITVSWFDRDLAKGKQRSFVKESKEMFKEIIRVRLNDLRGEYA